MKSLAIFSTFVMFFFFVSISQVEAATKKSEKTVVFEVSMDCHGCVKKIEDNIPYEKGVKDLKVSLDQKTCEITYREDKTSEKQLIKAFNKLGYKAEIKKAESETKSKSKE
ncbi:heavy-metal-associated domain-containing protein [Roseimarinus sediminis]|jgi:copper chaperone CopZ|uniref:heavy-metal-associated domain-containing protein n=1 Tax=Roseimarinus sediminis TaxID=1610899 RepID=UPI003D2440A2